MRALAADKLPQGITYEWTDLSYQEAKVGRTGYYIFVLSVIFVFLALAAQYESWSLPLAIMLIVPMCLFSAVIRRLAARTRDQHPDAGRLRGADRAGGEERHPDRGVRAPARGAGQGHASLPRSRPASLRLRPIIMTSLAFTLGVVPLYLAVGAGAEMRIALGTAVFWGMIGVTLFGLIFTPVFYVVIRRLTGSKRSRRVAAMRPPCSRRSKAHPLSPFKWGEGRREGPPQKLEQVSFLTLTLSPCRRAERECYAFHLPARFSANEARPSAASGERRLAA